MHNKQCNYFRLFQTPPFACNSSRCFCCHYLLLWLSKRSANEIFFKKLSARFKRSIDSCWIIQHTELVSTSLIILNRVLFNSINFQSNISRKSFVKILLNNFLEFLRVFANSIANPSWIVWVYLYERNESRDVKSVNARSNLINI